MPENKPSVQQIKARIRLGLYRLGQRVRARLRWAWRDTWEWVD